MQQTQSPLQDAVAQYLGRAQPEAAGRIEKHLAELFAQPGRSSFFRLFALAPRWTGRQLITPTMPEREALAALEGNLVTTHWTDDQLARLWIIRAVQDLWSAQQFSQELDTLFNTADTAELVALYRSLPLLRDPGQFNARAREGARSNMVSVFLAVAHYNDFPARFFDDEGWNQLVLKAVFNACALDNIVGLEQRNNPALSHMLSDYVRERWAASRDVPWDIWRCIGPHADTTGDLDLLATAMDSMDKLTRLAATLALANNDGAEARKLLTDRDTNDTIKNNSWQSLGALAAGG